MTLTMENPAAQAAPRNDLKFACRGVNVHYGDAHAIKDLAIDIEDRLVTAFIGPSGCGKSTFLRCLNRMNDTISICRVTGDLKLDGEDIYAPRVDPVQLRARVGMVFQKPNPFPKSIYDNVAYGPRIHGLTSSREELDALVESSLTKAGLESLQAALSLATLRLYLSDDPVGAQLGGALKNVVAIGAGMAIGGDFGESARSALMTRGFAEMVRYAALRKARRETLFGLSGFGDLVLTCTSTQSRNYRHGLAFGAGKPPEEKATVEGVMTAHAVSEASAEEDLPVTHMVSALLKGELSIGEAVESLLSRPLRRED